MSDEMDSIEEARDIMISALAQSMVIYGVTPSVGRIYGVLYFSTKPMTLDQIKDQVAMSKGSVSNGMRELLETDMVTKVWKKGERKDHYVADKDYLRNFLTFFVNKIRQERNLIMKGTEQAQPKLEKILRESSDDEVRAEAENDLNLIKNSHQYFDWTTSLANAMESGEIFDFLPKQRTDEGDNT